MAQYKAESGDVRFQQPGYNPNSYGGPPQPGYGQPGYGVQPGYGYPAPNQVYPGQPGISIVPVPPGAPVAVMNRPPPMPGCPPGLEYLTQINELKVKQQIELLEVFTGFETNNKYVIYNALGQQVYFAAEETDACMRICCGASRGFDIHILDNFRQPVMKISREFKCCAGCCWCAGCCDACAFEVVVEAPAGNPVGYVKQSGSFIIPCYEIMDENHTPIFKIEGPCCILDGPCCPVDNDFMVMNMDGATVGKISKNYAGFIKEAVSKADNFSISFPVDLAVKLKATMLGALFLIDFMFFERQENNNNRRY